MAKANTLARFRQDDGANTEAIKTIAIGMILIVLSFVIALTTWPLLTSSVATAQGDANTTANQSTLLGLIPLTIVVALVLGGVAYMFQGIRQLRN